MGRAHTSTHPTKCRVGHTFFLGAFLAAFFLGAFFLGAAFFFGAFFFFGACEAAAGVGGLGGDQCVSGRV